MTRPSIYQTLAEIAVAWSKRSTCSKRHVGAVIATQEKGVIVSSGYNGAPAGMPHCEHGCDCDQPGFSRGQFRCLETCASVAKCTTAIHAEENAILFAARAGVSTYGRMLVATYGPCERCARMIIQAGVDFVIYLEPNSDLRALNTLYDNGITTLHLKDPTP